MSEEQRDHWDLQDVAGYIAAALTKAGRESEWPDNTPGNAARLLTQDLGQFAESIVAVGRADYWSPAKALERMFIERVEVLMGASVDSAVAQRYLDSVMAEPTAERPARPAKRARPGDALAQFFAKAGISDEEREGFRAAWLQIKNLNSDWFVHPTAMGPMLSRLAAESPDAIRDQWLLLIQVLAQGCFFVVAAANPLRVALPVEVVRAIYAAAKCLEQERANQTARRCSKFTALSRAGWRFARSQGRRRKSGTQGSGRVRPRRQVFAGIRSRRRLSGSSR